MQLPWEKSALTGPKHTCFFVLATLNLEVKCTEVGSSPRFCGEPRWTPALGMIPPAQLCHGLEYQADNKQFEGSQGRTRSLCFFQMMLQRNRKAFFFSDSGYQSARDVLLLHPGKCLVKGVSAGLTWLFFQVKHHRAIDAACSTLQSCKGCLCHLSVFPSTITWHYF